MFFKSWRKGKEVVRRLFRQPGKKELTKFNFYIIYKTGSRGGAVW